MNERLRPPCSYPGGKSYNDAVEIAWGAMGADVATYIEPCCGMASMFLARPGGPGKYEVLNDINANISNVWRALRNSPTLTAAFVDQPPNEIELAAKAKRLRETDLAELLKADPVWCDYELAADWIWCQCVSYSPDWLNQKTPPIHKPHRKGILSPNADIDELFNALFVRLRRVSICNGDFSRVLTPSALGFHNTGTTPTGVFFDCPYKDERIDYGTARDVGERAETWCRENGDDKRLRVVLCGHVGDYDLPGWRLVNWGGSRGWGRAKRGQNECFWLSPHCLEPNGQKDLFEVAQ